MVAGGKETCDGDDGSPLLCDIDGEVTLVGVNSRGYNQCGVEGLVAKHTDSLTEITYLKDDYVQND